MATTSHFCEKCNRTMDVKEFYRSNNLEKYPEGGYMNTCKKCLTMHVDNWNPDTFLWILEDIDVPWVPEEWNKLMMTYARDPAKVTGVTIIGRYLSKMRLKQFKDFRWKDTEFLKEMNNKKIKETMESQGYEAADIARALEKAGSTIPEGGVAPPPPPPPAPEAPPPLNLESMGLAPPPRPQFDDGPDYFDQQNDLNESDLALDLTDDEKIKFRLKWGKQYKPEEWVQLEKLYDEMMKSYDIQTAGHIDTLKKICRVSLKADQLLNIGDIDGAQKAIKMYDMLMKSGKFTAAQNKAENGEFLDSISELVTICEKQGFIPRYYIDSPKDKVDRVLQDLQGYTRTLVTEEMNLGVLIENAVKQIEKDKENEARQDADQASDDDFFENQLFEDEENRMFQSYEDYEELKENEEEQAAHDEELLKNLMEGKI